jgi:uncharacterized protein with HEPN domain
MKHKLGDLERINHIIDAIQKIELFTNGVSMDEFKNNIEKHLATERLLEIIGEAAKHISEEVLFDEDNATPWKLIIGLRNILSHEYFRVDSNAIYQLATIDIIPLKKEILRIKQKLEIGYNL